MEISIDWSVRDCFEKFRFGIIWRNKEQLGKIASFLSFFFIRKPVAEKYSSQSDRNKSDAK